MSGDLPNICFEERFTVLSVDKDGKKFDRVTRITAESEALNVNITLDLANELIQFKPKEKFSLALARSLHPELEAEAARGGVDKANEVKREMWRGGEQGLAEEYDYVMHGKVYKFDDSARGADQTTAYISFGGLLLALRGSYRHLQNIIIGENIFLLMRK